MGLEPNIRRILRDLRNIWADPPPFCRPGASPMTDLLHWEVVIDGPDDSPYAGGTFPVDVDLVGDYPFEPPKITFRTKVYHPNIKSDGEMTLDILHKDWSAGTTIHGILIFIVHVLCNPMLDGQWSNDEVNDVYESDIELYEQLAMAWTWEYSSAPIVPHYPTEEDERRLNHLAARRAADEEEE